MINAAIRILFVLMGVAATARALPLHPGAEWVYDRINFQLGVFSGLRDISTLRVLDSTRVGSMLYWNLVLRDSSTGLETALQVSQDTAGRQSWSVNPRALNPWYQNAFIPWDPVPPGSSNARPWTYSPPEYPGVWSDSVGWLWYETGSWILLSHDKKPVAHPWELRLPEVGSTWRWKITTRTGDLRSAGSCTDYPFDSAVSIVQWRVVERQDDSSGWLRIQVQQSSLPGGDSLISLRFDTARILSRSTLGRNSFEETWWKVPSPGQYERNGFIYTARYSESTTMSQFGFNWSVSRSVRKINRGGTLDSAWYFAESKAPASHIGGLNCHLVESEIILLEENGRTGVWREALPGGAERLKSLAARHPSTQIRWRDIQGRGGLFPASELDAFLARRRTGLRVLEAQFPDGTRWSGRVF